MTAKVALVTGASRGAGRGIARGFGELGYTVYVTGRTVTPGDAKGWDGTVLPGTVAETAAEVTAAGGRGIAVMCDHANDANRGGWTCWSTMPPISTTS
jgi:NAD(P)-dependent dehydrogenase (short-subunit alcohol dehydrogenase family)